MKKKSLVILTVTIATILSGCNNDVSEIKSLSPLDTSANVKAVALSASDKESLVYAQVIDRQLLDTASLDKVSDLDTSTVKSYMDLVDSQLTGALDKSNGVINKSFTDYLLHEFAKTPYYWQRSSMSIVGKDASSQSIVVDVTYKTLGSTLKTVKPESRVVLGEQDYTKKMEVRFQRYLSIMSLKYGKTYSTANNWQSLYSEFVNVYGDVNTILQSQKETSLTDSIYTTGNQLTYTGITKGSHSDVGGTMVVRYVLVPKYTLGINEGISCKHMYISSYKVDTDFTSGLKVYTADGSDIIADNVYNKVYSYFKCIDEQNYTGLYNLSTNFSNWDLYYSDYFDTAYTTHENFTLTLLNVTGKVVECVVTISSKERARNTNMTLPIYADKYYIKLELTNGNLQVSDILHLSRALEGEPTIKVNDAQTTGFSSAISLQYNDKKVLEDLISKFGVLQLNSDTTSQSFSDIVDTSVSDKQLNELKTDMTSIPADKKVTWIVSYLQGQSNYASIKCKELLQKSDGTIYEYSVVYDFINKANTWYIYGYKIDAINRLDTKELSVKNSLCVTSKSGVDSFNSQIEGSSTVSENTSNTNITGVTVNYNPYAPVLK